jgi:ATP-binding cassette subfamily F protein 3
MEDYRRLILQGPEAVKRARDKEAKDAVQASTQNKRRDAAQKRGQLKPLKQKIDATDKEIRRLQDKIRKLDTALADPGFFTREPERATKFTKERAFCEKKLGKAEEEWLELSAEFEEAS